MNMQEFADMLKAPILDMPGIGKARRLDALRTIQKFENCRWHFDAMNEALNTVDSGFEYPDPVSLIGEGEDYLDNIERIYAEYSQHIDCESPPVLDEIYNMEEAAQYLGIAKDTMYKYVSRQKRIRGKKIGRSMVFTRQQLDDFKREEM